MDDNLDAFDLDKLIESSLTGKVVKEFRTEGEGFVFEFEDGTHIRFFAFRVPVEFRYAMSPKPSQKS